MSHSPSQTLTADQVKLPAGHIVRKLPVLGTVLGVIGLAATFAMGSSQMKQVYFSMLVSSMFFLSIGLGCLFFVLVQFATKAGWSVVVRRFAENIAMTLPIIGIFCLIVVLAGKHDLFHWTHTDVVANDKILKGKVPYLNETFFTIRAIVYVVIWSALAFFFRKTSLTQDATGDMQLTRKMQNRAYPGIALFALSLTFAAFDWMMSLDPHWFSTIFGVYFFAGCVLACYATMIITVMLTRGSGFLERVISVHHFHDLGKMLFAFVVFWSYIGFSQYFLIWYGNMPEETIWYAHRMAHGWDKVSILLLVGHFFIPFFFLLPRTIKRTPATLLLGACWMLAIHFVDLYWIIMPTLQTDGFGMSPLDLTAFIGVGGIFVALVSRNIASSAVVPYRDPRLSESMAFENI